MQKSSLLAVAAAAVAGLALGATTALAETGKKFGPEGPVVVVGYPDVMPAYGIASAIPMDQNPTGVTYAIDNPSAKLDFVGLSVAYDLIVDKGAAPPLPKTGMFSALYGVDDGGIVKQPVDKRANYAPPTDPLVKSQTSANNAGVTSKCMQSNLAVYAATIDPAPAVATIDGGSAHVGSDQPRFVTLGDPGSSHLGDGGSAI